MLHDGVMTHFTLNSDDRGDVPGWVLITLMTAGLVVVMWAMAGPALGEVFNNAIDRVLSI
ncbi:MAG: hypothetical protein RLZZ441_522 [Actinomycetota bacterium]